MSKRKVFVATFAIMLFFLVVHSVPTLALRTSIFFHGYPVVAVTTEIQEYVPYSQYDRELLEKENARLFKLTPPPVEKATQGYLYTWKVSKKAFLYFARYHGEG